MPTTRDVYAQLLKGAAAAGSKVPEIVGPQPAQYGVYGSNYGAALQTMAGDYRSPYAAFGMSHLNTKANEEMDSYEAQLAAAQAAQLKAQDTAGYYDLAGKALDKNADGMFTDSYGVRINPATGRAEVIADPVYGAAQNALTADEKQAGTYATKTKGYLDAASAGQVMDSPTYSLFTRGALNSVETTPQSTPGMKPADATARYAADQGLTYDQQYTLKELEVNGLLERARISAASGDGEYTAQYSPKGDLIGFTKKGTAPPGEVNPKAVAHTGGATATLAGDPKAFFSHAGSSEGMRTDPITGKPRMHKGKDFAKPRGTPIPAEQDGKIIQVGNLRGFGPYANLVEYQDGSRVIYGHNDSSLPVGTVVKRGQAIGTVGSRGRSTGPHVHRQVARGPQRVASVDTNRITVVMQRAIKAHPDAKVEQVGNEVHITNPTTGTVFRFGADGKQIK